MIVFIFRLRRVYQAGTIKEAMYFALVIGALHTMRWMMSAANRLVFALPRRPGIGGALLQGKRNFR
jgi:hypothetical protein